jgi:hypothetical protein
MKLRTLLLGSALSLTAHAGDEHQPPPPPPLPWFVDAYVGLERDPRFQREPETKDWLWQNTIQFSEGKLLLRRETVSCHAGTIFSTEGDGGAESYEATLLNQRPKDLRFLFLGCDQCFPGTVLPNLVLHFERVSPTVVRLGGVTYSSQTKPYAERCPVGT